MEQKEMFDELGEGRRQDKDPSPVTIFLKGAWSPTVPTTQLHKDKELHNIKPTNKLYYVNIK